jgi:site-specific DNA recombinase
MKAADLYIRVSTDEQADKGYSQRSQEELLRKYCDINDIAVRNVIFEDHSAKTFNRPQWKKYLLDIKKQRGKTDLLLFIKWDRFSRNAGDAYQMINILRKHGVEPQAIEQPLDLSIPENKMMLAFYLAAPEVENDRRALNVRSGMRRAMKEGRYMGKAPIGYTNKTDDSGRKFISPDAQQSKILKWAFEEIVKGVYNIEQVFKEARKKGFKKTRSLFYFAIRNPVYCGKIFIPRFKDEESKFVKAQHEPIISEGVFYEAQDVIDGRKRTYKLKVVSNESLPLRGSLICPECGKLLSGSASKGRNKYYPYYHCYDGCKFRLKAEDVNDQFVKELKKYVPMEEIWQEVFGTQTDDRKIFRQQIKEVEEKISYAMDLLTSRLIDPTEFRDMKVDYNNRLDRLKSKLNSLGDEDANLQPLLDNGLKTLLRLEYIYVSGDITKKQEVISTIFPDKLFFENNLLRTGEINAAAKLIYHISKELKGNNNSNIQGESYNCYGLEKNLLRTPYSNAKRDENYLIIKDLLGNKKGRNENKFISSCKVGKTGFEPATTWSQTRCATGLRYFPSRD